MTKLKNNPKHYKNKITVNIINGAFIFGSQKQNLFINIFRSSL